MHALQTDDRQTKHPTKDSTLTVCQKITERSPNNGHYKTPVVFSEM